MTRLFKAHRKTHTLDPEARKYFEESGFVVIEGLLSPSETLAAKTAILELAASERESGIAHNYGPNMQRVWNLLNKHPVFQDLITSPQILAWMEHLFDRPTSSQKYYLSSLQANMNKAGAPGLHLHIDTPIPEPLPPWIIKANTIWILDDFTQTNGATEVIPGSHKRTRKPRRDDPADEEGIIKVIAPAGSVIITHGALWHRSGANRSSQDRTVLLGSFAASFAREIASEEDTVRCLHPDTLDTMSDELKSLIGYNHGLKPGGGLAR